MLRARWLKQEEDHGDVRKIIISRLDDLLV
jgi:hypothetical protein